MATGIPTSRPKKVLKVLLIVVSVFVLSILGLHIWFVNNARGVLRDIVYSKSQGKIKLELSQLSFNFFSKELQVGGASIYSADTLNQATTYNIKFKKLTLRVASVWPLLFQKKLVLDSIKLQDPAIEVTQWRKDTSFKLAANDLSIPQEMGKLYKSMLDVLDNFGIMRIIINNARLSLINKMRPGVDPVTINKIFFDLKRTERGSGKIDEFIDKEQSVSLNTTDQYIVFPGGRHRLSFRNFHLELFRKRIELDSCTLIAEPTDSSKSSYKIFFDKLLLVGVDFNAMYQSNLIRADSVYCEAPLFDIFLNPSNEATTTKKGRPNPEKLVRELTGGNLDLAFVGVKNAGIHINIGGAKKRSLFNSNKDDFKMLGLSINADSAMPVSVKRFDMLVRDYRLFNEDSSSAYTFDSIHFLNNKIALNNFSVVTNPGAGSRHNKRDFKIPYFELTGMDWYELIFNQNLYAEEAALYNPVIFYEKRKQKGKKKKTNLFASLQSLDSMMTLNKINVINGQINMKLGPQLSMNLENANLSLYSNRLLQSSGADGIRRAIDLLSFSNGKVKYKDITAQLINARYTGTSLVRADKLLVESKSNAIKAAINDVYLDNLLLDDETEMMLVDGIRWKNATVSMQMLGAGKGKKGKGVIDLKNISGSNTTLKISSPTIKVQSFFETIKVASLQKKGSEPINTTGLLLVGSDLRLHAGPLHATSSSFRISGSGPSFATDVEASKIEGKDSLLFRVPQMLFTADINSILAGSIHLPNLELSSPLVKIAKWSSVPKDPAKPQKINLQVDHLTAREPVLSISTHINDSITQINLPYSKNSLLTASDISVDKNGFRAGALSAKTTSATFVKKTGEVMGVENGSVVAELSNIELSKKGDKPFWNATINGLSLKNPNSIILGKGKNKLVLKEGSIGNVNLSSDYVNDVDKLLKFNVSAWLRTATGEYSDSNTTLKWYNAGYDYKKSLLSLDSFSYFPTQPLDSVMANTPFQTDYITLKTGAIAITNFNLKKYEKDSAIIANTIQITHPEITVYRDKQPPFLAGIIKPLPVDLIKRISLPIAVQQVLITDGLLSYTEKHAKTRAEGTLYLTRLNGVLSNIKNRNFVKDDSLLFKVNGYLMDSAQVHLRVKESYDDSLSGFLLTLRMKPTSLSFLNPVLAPLSNVKIASGTIDSMHLRAVGRDELALGEMKMYYHNLRIKLIKDGDENNTTFLRNAASFLANTFLIKRNNEGRTGLVYFKRLRDRSFFNYIVKMTFSGMATSIGVVKNKKYRKQYKKELEQRDLPPIVID